MNRKESFAVGEYYHVYSRGNNKQVIFIDDEDRSRFVKLLYLCNSKGSFNFRDDIIKAKIDAYDYDRGSTLVSIGAWVLMPNHFHLLLTIPSSPKSHLGLEADMNISIFMQKLLTSYSKYFNKKYARTGGLFESNFMSTLLGTDRYLKYIFSYIHLNPVKLIDSNWKDDGIKNKGLTIDFLKKYKWSSYEDYIGIRRPCEKVITKSDFPEYFSSIRSFNEEIIDWLSFAEE